MITGLSILMLTLASLASVPHHGGRFTPSDTVGGSPLGIVMPSDTVGGSPLGR
jgi:hypothetical protein